MSFTVECYAVPVIRGSPVSVPSRLSTWAFRHSRENPSDLLSRGQRLGRQHQGSSVAEERWERGMSMGAGAPVSSRIPWVSYLINWIWCHTVQSACVLPSLESKCSVFCQSGGGAGPSSMEWGRGWGISLLLNRFQPTSIILFSPSPQLCSQFQKCCDTDFWVFLHCLV